MTTLELLRQIAATLASHIDAANEEQLRRFSSTIAQAAVERSGLSNPTITEALHHLSMSGQSDADLQARVKSVAKQLDEYYFNIQQSYEDRQDAGKTAPDVVLAFARARAASAVAAALQDVARIAAAEAAYEAIAATDDAEYFTRIVQN
jgi:hypothetical protein